MAGLYDADGNIKLTVNGSTSTFRGLYATDGSWNAFIVSGGGWKGRFAPDGGLNITVVGTYSSYYAADGSINVIASGGNYIIPRPGFVGSSNAGQAIGLLLVLTKAS